MTLNIALLETILLVAAAIYAKKQILPLQARRVSLFAMILVGFLSLCVATSTIHIVIGIVGLVAVALSPATNTSPSTFMRILLLTGSSLLFVSIQSPLGLAILWSLSGLLTWSELYGRSVNERVTARVFAMYQIPSMGLFWFGAVFLQQGNTGAALIPLLLAISIREAMIPVHSWFPHFVERAPMGIVVAFVGPQLGIYTHLQVFAHGLPADLNHFIALLGACTAVLAAAIGTIQMNARRALAFLFMSQSGLVTFGLETHSSVGHAGALLTWHVVALATSAFFMTLAALEARRGDLSLRVPNGSFTQTPRMAVVFLLLGFASVGLPLTAGFIAEDLLVQGSVDEFPFLGLALIVATALNGLTVMRAFFALFSGSSQHLGEQDLTKREARVLTLVLAILLFVGIYPHKPLQWFMSETSSSQGE